MVGNGPMPPNRITMQYFQPDDSEFSVPALDAVLADTRHGRHSSDGEWPTTGCPPRLCLWCCGL